MVYKHADFKVNQIKNVARVTENFLFMLIFSKKIFFQHFQHIKPRLLITHTYCPSLMAITKAVGAIITKNMLPVLVSYRS